MTDSANRKTQLPNAIDSLLSLAIFGGAVAAVPAIVGARQWFLDNLSSGAPHMFVALSLLAIIAFVRRSHHSALIAVVAVTLLGVRIYPHLDFSAEQSTPPQATWLVANVHTSNQRHEALLALVRERSPDVIGLVETDSRWLQALDEPLREYSHRVLHPRDDNFGIALYSRIPLIRPELKDFGIVPTITATISVDNREIDLVLVHVLPPISREYTEERNAQLARIGALRPREGHGLVIAGDFNATPFSPTFRGSFAQPPFKRAGGIAGTFPSVAPNALRIPIDHVLAAGSVRARRTLEREIMSDHVPMMIELRAE